MAAFGQVVADEIVRREREASADIDPIGIALESIDRARRGRAEVNLSDRRSEMGHVPAAEVSGMVADATLLTAV